NSERFAVTHPEPSQAFDGVLISNPDFAVEAIPLNHFGVSLGYIVRESQRENLCKERMAELNLKPGRWVGQLTKTEDPDVEIDTGNGLFSVGSLRSQLMVKSDGQSFAYLTDFLLCQQAHQTLSQKLEGIDHLLCEAQYRHSDHDLAVKNFHSTTLLVAGLARDANVGELTLFHVSDRYDRDEWGQMLSEAKAVFPNTKFPSHWDLG
ncbi:MAG: ribonuclease Z, partial [Planctomycetaceae bacterium]